MSEEIIDIISRYLETGVTPGERERLDAWLGESEEHIRYFLQCKNMHDATHPAFDAIQINVEKAWKRVMPAREWDSVRGWIRLAAVAAVVALCIGGALLGLRQGGQSGGGVAWNHPVVLSAPAGVTLTLASGEQIEVGDAVPRDITAGASTVARAENNTLAYASGKSALDTVQYHILNVPRGKEFFLILEDGTKVWVNAGTEVRYPVTFAGGERRIFVKGEIFLEVLRNEEAPFTVVTPGTEITVLGTSFNVKAYPEEAQQAVTLVNGKVQVIASESDRALTLSPGEQAVVGNADGTLFKQDVDTDLYCAWHTGSFVFRSSSLLEMMTLVSRRYNVEVRWQEEALKQMSFSGELKKQEDITPLLDKIAHTGEVKFELAGNELLVSRP